MAKIFYFHLNGNLRYGGWKKKPFQLFSGPDVNSFDLITHRAVKSDYSNKKNRRTYLQLEKSI
jgi:hypothetical protein